MQKHLHTRVHVRVHTCACAPKRVHLRTRTYSCVCLCSCHKCNAPRPQRPTAAPKVAGRAQPTTEDKGPPVRLERASKPQVPSIGLSIQSAHSILSSQPRSNLIFELSIDRNPSIDRTVETSVDGCDRSTDPLTDRSIDRSIDPSMHPSIQ